MREASLLVLHAGELATVGGDTPGREVSRRALVRVPDGAVAIEGERIAAVGESHEISARWRSERTLDAEGGAVTAALADPHTHLVFAGERGREFAARVRGEPLPAGLAGGIAETVRATAAAPDEVLRALTRARLDRWLAAGVTLVEVKSGYGLDVASELRLLALLQEAARGHAVEVVPTLLAAHALPAPYDGRERDYLDEVADPAARAARERGLAECADAFVEEGAFSAEAALAHLERCRALGLVPRVHAEQLSRSGGTQVAVRVGAASADHLERAGEEEVRALAGSHVSAVLSPGAALTVDGRSGTRPPARALLTAGVPVALATDYNPGTSLLPAPGLLPALATRLFGMTPDEALAGVTAAAAGCLGRGERLGRLAPGFRADLCVWEVPRPVDLAYELSEHRPRVVVARGRVVHRRPAGR
jgi:imidazolonepropionase